MIDKAYIVNLLKNRDLAVARALVALKNRQTSDEQVSETTKHNNKMGFRPCHAFIGTEMANFYEKNGFLTKKQISYWRTITGSGKMRIEIYAGQLLNIAKQKQ